jgi:hypothetical protein
MTILPDGLLFTFSTVLVAWLYKFVSIPKYAVFKDFRKHKINVLTTFLTNFFPEWTAEIEDEIWWKNAMSVSRIELMMEQYNWDPNWDPRQKQMVDYYYTEDVDTTILLSTYYHQSKAMERKPPNPHSANKFDTKTWNLTQCIEAVKYLQRTDSSGVGTTSRVCKRRLRARKGPDSSKPLGARSVITRP